MKFFRFFGRAETPDAEKAFTPAQSVALTHVGHVRAVNEDRILSFPEARLWAVADGMGGHHSGDVAAQIAVDLLENLVSRGQALCGEDILAALHSANSLIYDRYADVGRRSGTTIVAALLNDDELEIFWAGDSRAYRLRSGMWQLLTRDHSLVQQMVDSGALPPSAAANHPQSNVITRALGVDREVEIERLRTTLLSGDIIMLCSDGISRTLASETPGGSSTEMLAETLLNQALALDGSDNASLILVGPR